MELEKEMNQLQDDMANLLSEENEGLVETISVLQERIDILESIQDEHVKTIADKDRNLRDMTMLSIAVAGIVFSYGLFYGIYFACR